MPELVVSVVGRPLVEGSHRVGADVRVPRPGVGRLLRLWHPGPDGCKGAKTMHERAEGYYWVRIHDGDQPEIAIWRRGQWWFTATHLPVLPDNVVVLSERLRPPDDWDI